jgi:hypothetical protein
MERKTRGAPPLAITLLATIIQPACSWDHLDAIGALPAGPDASLGATLDAEGQDVIGAPDGASADTRMSIDGQPLDERPDFDANEGSSAPEASALDGATPSLACNDLQAPVRQWAFDADVEGWTFFGNPSVRGTVSWVGSTGSPAPGALKVDVTQLDNTLTAQGSWVQYATPLGPLGGRTVSAMIWLDAGPSPRVKLFVQTGTQYAWGDGGTVVLTPLTWTCLTLSVSEPSYNGPNYDPSSVMALGFELLGSEPFRVYVDSVRY